MTEKVGDLLARRSGTREPNKEMRGKRSEEN